MEGFKEGLAYPVIQPQDYEEEKTSRDYGSRTGFEIGLTKIGKSVPLVEIEELKLKDLEYYRKEIKLSYRQIETAAKVYEKLGQFEYPLRERYYTIDFKTIVWKKSKEIKYIYTGQILPDSQTFDGSCIIVYNNGSTDLHLKK